MSEILITRATIYDSKDIWVWRNDELTRAMSFSSDVLSWESHSSWFDKSLMDKNKRFYVGRLLSSNQKVGMCRFDINEVSNDAEVSINLNPVMRGLGLSDKLLSASMKFFFEEHKIDLIAKIKLQNLASIKCFIKCGFVFRNTHNGYNFYTYNTLMSL